MTSFLHRCGALWRNVSRPQQVERELDAELQSTFALMVDEKTDAGIGQREAERAVRLELGPEQVKEQVRSARNGARLESIARDIRYAFRSFLRTPGFTIVALVTLALGIGANTAMIAAVRAVSLSALPFDRPDRLAMVWEEATWAGFPQNTPAPANYVDWRRMNHVFSDMAATRGAIYVLTGDGPPEQLRGRAVTANFFSVLGVAAAAGRAFAADDAHGDDALMLISDRLWARRYGRDPSLIGRSVRVNGANVTVIGVLPPAFVFRDRDIDIWRLMRFTPEVAANRDSHFLTVVARLRPGVSMAQARADMTAIARHLAAAYPDSNRQLGVAVAPMAEDVLGNARLAVIVLTAAAACVLLIACANLAGLLLSRAVKRHGELAMRIALGASGGRLMQQALVESMVLALAGGALGALLAPVGMRALGALMPSGLPVAAPSLDLRLLGFAIAVSLLTGILCGMTPAVMAGRSAIQKHLQQEGRSSVRGHNRLRDVLVVAQISAALVLLAGAGLMLRTLANLRGLELGFSPDHLVTVRTTLPAQRYTDPQQRVAFYAQVADATRALPNVRAAAYVSTVPFAERGNSTGYIVEGQPPDTRFQDALLRVGTGSYLATLGARIVEGRLLGEQDGQEAAAAIVVNETFVRRHWPRESALGHRVSISGADGPWRTIVGVVADVRERGYLLETKPAV
jgi:putative ABC transport system permease protein